MIIDSHAHLNFQDFDDSWQTVIDDCLVNNTWVINVGAQLATSKKAIEIAENYQKGVYAAVALHPIHVLGSKFHPEKFQIDDYVALIKSSEKVVAIGETGIDFFHNDDTFGKQKEIFLKHISLAKQFDLPMIIHARNSKDGTKNAYRALLEILQKERPKKGVIHCFGGNLKEAMEFLDIGFYVGFTGIITFDKTGNLSEVAKSLPLESILVETDSPYLAPVPYRGKRNQPQYVRYVAEKIAEIKEKKYNQIKKQTAKNTIKLFNLNN